MACLHTTFHMPSSNSSLFIAIKLKTKSVFHSVAILLFYILQKRKIYYHTSFQYFILSGNSVTSMSKTHACICHVVITDCRKLKIMQLGCHAVAHCSFQMLLEIGP